ncbi:unnamed protein product [Tuber aestivum]|uniref:Uncharacterized protein n=1 Tax=Tuber aestivum TaxID=59557 RepID=A0A292QAP8_9PEZI|nr:unnamed protein product [Tuber aestivum]
MTLLSLPNELLLQISTEQSLPEVGALLRANRRLATLLRPALLGNLIRIGSHEYAKRALYHFGERGDTRTVAWLLDRRVLEMAGTDVLVDMLSVRNEAAVLTLLDAGLDPGICCLFNRTLLMLAAEHGCVGVVEGLLARGEGVDVNALNGWHTTALCTAIQCSQREVVMMLLADPRVDINTPGRGTRLAPLQLAMSLCLTDVVAAITRDPRVEIPPPGEDTWLHWAVQYGCKDVLSLLLADPRLDVNARNQAGATAYMTAVLHAKRWSIYLLLKDDRVDRSLGPEPPDIPMNLAAWHGWPEVMRILLADETVDVNFRYGGDAPLHAAIHSYQPGIVRMLVDDPRVDVNLCCMDEPPLSLAAGSMPPCPEIVLLLLSRDDVDLGILNRGVPEDWNPNLQKAILRDVVRHAQSKPGALAPRAIPASVMEQIRARGGRRDPGEPDDDW